MQEGGGEGGEGARQERFPQEKVRATEGETLEVALLKYFSPAWSISAANFASLALSEKTEAWGRKKKTNMLRKRSDAVGDEKMVLKITRIIVMMMMVVMNV